MIPQTTCQLEVFQDSECSDTKKNLFWNYFAGMLYERFSSRMPHYVLIGQTTCEAISSFWWVKYKNICYTGTTLQELCIKGPLQKIPHFIMIGQRTWPSDTNKISDWPNTNEISENTWLIGTKLCNLCMSSKKIPHFVLIRWSVWSMVFNTTFSNISVSVLCPSCLFLRQRDELPCGGCDNCFEGLNYPQCERG